MKILIHSGCGFGRLVQRPSLLADQYVIQAGRLDWLEGAEKVLIASLTKSKIPDLVKEHTWENRIKTIKQAFQANAIPWPTSFREPINTVTISSDSTNESASKKG